jgi:hypothetical protein
VDTTSKKEIKNTSEKKKNKAAEQTERRENKQAGLYLRVWLSPCEGTAQFSKTTFPLSSVGATTAGEHFSLKRVFFLMRVPLVMSLTQLQQR